MKSTDPTITVTRRTLIDVPVDEAWLLLSNTGQVNHAMGLPKITYTPHPNGQNPGELNGYARYFGIPVRWIERPFEWISPRSFTVQRVFKRLPFLRAITTGSTINAASHGRSEVISSTSAEPRSRIGAWLSWALLWKLEHDHIKSIRRIAAAHRADQPDYFPPASRIAVDTAALEQMLERLGTYPIDAAILERLAHVIRTGRDEDVIQMRPFVLADRWATNRLDTLRLFLYATQAGMLDLNWDVLCPNCRISSETVATLSDLNGQSHCDTCRIRYDVNFDDYVELRFSVNPAVRVAHHTMYCAIGGPSYNRHIVAQRMLDAGDRSTLQLELEPGGYRIRVLGSEQRCVLRVDSGTSSTTATLDIADAGVTPPTLELAPGPITLHLHHTGTQQQVLIVEHDAWGTQHVSAALVTTLPEFRALFSSEVLAPGLGLSIKNLTLFFSDLKNSTPMYEQIGDSPAYALVRDHFTILTEVIAQHTGTIVKTIGDAVMAVFSTAADGVAAALEIQQRIERFNAQRPGRTPIIIKMGLHTGPCIAVNANDVLDYFGTTVNAAARAQSISTGGDIVLTADVMNAPVVKSLLDPTRLHIEQFSRDLKGLSQSYTLYRLTPQNDVLKPATHPVESVS